VSWPGVEVWVLALVVGVLLVAAVVLAAGGAPPSGDVGLVGASVHAAVAVATHTKPSQARTILIDMVQTA
jgi:hypothetical protein